MIEAITDLLERDPFQPFCVILTSGDRFDVVNPHLVALGQTMIVYCHPRSDRVAYLRLNQIAAVDLMQPAA